MERSRAALACACWVCLVAVTAAARERDAPRSGRARADFHVWLQGPARTAVQHGIAGALERLLRPECQRLFAELATREGRPLVGWLDELGLTPSEYLATLRFADGDATRPCLESDIRAAYTVPFSRVIYVCGSRFTQMFIKDTRFAQMIIIHELLHAAGLGENPPSSSWITHRVIARCRA